MPKAKVHRQRNDDAGMVNARKLRSTARWQRLVKAYRQANPLCELCQRQGRVTAMNEVHHIQQVATHPELALRWNNLAALCTKCHAKVSMCERRGGDAAALFATRTDRDVVRWGV